MSNSNPSLNPANNGSLAGTLQFVYNKLMQQTDGMLPAQVIAYDRETNRVQVQMLVTLVTTDGTQVPRPQIASLPVLLLGGGGFSISFPLKTGDMGWVMANDRDISLFLQSYAQSPPNTKRMKNFSDGLFIPDAMKSANITDANENYMVLQSTDGTISIEMGINPVTTAHEINVTAQRINVNVGATGFLAVTGNIVASGTIACPAGTVIPGTPMPYPP